MTTTATIQGGLLATGRASVEQVKVGDLWHAYRDQFPRRIVSVRNVRGGRRITDQFGCSKTFRAGESVPTATLIGGEWPEGWGA